MYLLFVLFKNKTVMMMKRRNKILFTQNRQFYVLTCLGGFGKNKKSTFINLEIDSKHKFIQQ